MDLNLKDKVVVVTGSGEGIGKRTVLTFAREGCNVVVNDIVASKAESVAKEVEALGVKTLVAVADVSNMDEVDGMIKKVFLQFTRIDILVNNAFAWDRKPFSKSAREDWVAPINVCLYGTLHCTKAVINHMTEARYGKIINVVSDAGRVGEANSPIYAAAKAGIIAFSKSLAKEVGHYNINVNCVSPAAVNTERRIREHQMEWEQATAERREWIKQRDQTQLRLYPLGRLGEPEDIANVIVFLASDRARYITGQVISVNGGYIMVG